MKVIIGFRSETQTEMKAGITSKLVQLLFITLENLIMNITDSQAGLMTALHMHISNGCVILDLTLSQELMSDNSSCSSNPSLVLGLDHHHMPQLIVNKLQVENHSQMPRQSLEEEVVDSHQPKNSKPKLLHGINHGEKKTPLTSGPHLMTMMAHPTISNSEKTHGSQA